MRCTIQEIPLPEAEGLHECISYVWGKESKLIKVICDGEELGVTVNLNDALRRFRLPNDTRRVWADAVCINQLDHTEKSD